jgi:hypothetical protein
MVEKPITSSRNVVDLSRYRELNAASRAPAISARLCRHCGAALQDGESEEECSSAFNSEALRLRWQAADSARVDLEHDPEKCAAVFRKDHARSKER